MMLPYNENEKKISVRKLSLSDINEYTDFLFKYYGERFYVKYYDRYKWYENRKNFYVLIALCDGEIVGQSCAVRCDVMIKGKQVEWWWGVDAFVLQKMRGKGIGKMLQNELHCMFPNFSSAWYSKVNGIIKKKCGANSFFYNNSTYYPVSVFMIFGLQMILNKLFKKNIIIKHPFFYFYYYLNLRKRKFIVTFNSIKKCDQDIQCFISECLHDKDFYTLRDCDYMDWKYFNNPAVKINNMIVSEGKKVIALAFFTDCYDYIIANTQLKYAKILDIFILPEVDCKEKDILLEIIRFFKNKKIKIDGVVALDSGYSYYPKYTYMKQALLSTHIPIKLSTPYMSFSDQDMEQMK